MCNKCFLFATNPVYRQLRGGDGNVRTVVGAAAKPRAAISTKNLAILEPDCPFRGPLTGESGACQTCGGGSVPVPYCSCSKFGDKCYTGARHPKTGRSCMQCFPKLPKELLQADALPPMSKVRFEGLKGHFNGSIIEDGDGYLLASRVESKCFMTSLDSAFHVLWTRPLNLHHPDSANGQDDPRLYRFGNGLRISFAGNKATNGRLRVSQLYAELTDDLHPREPKPVPFSGAGFVEKNWMPFEHQGRQYFVHSINPEHVVIEIGLDKCWVHRTENKRTWSGGHHRGGTPPIRVGDRFISFTHGNLRIGADDYWYSIGAYEFEAEPPFRVIRQTPVPLMWAKESDAIPRPGREKVRVVFPAGAILQGDEWLVSQGTRDEAIELLRWKVKDVEGAMK